MGGDGILFWRFVMQPSVKYCSCNDEKGGIKGANEYITEDVTLHLEPPRFNLGGIRCEFSSPGNISSYFSNSEKVQAALAGKGRVARPPSGIHNKPGSCASQQPICPETYNCLLNRRRKNTAQSCSIEFWPKNERKKQVAT